MTVCVLTILFYSCRKCELHIATATHRIMRQHAKQKYQTDNDIASYFKECQIEQQRLVWKSKKKSRLKFFCSLTFDYY